MENKNYFDGFLRQALVCCMLFLLDVGVLAQAPMSVRGTVLDESTREPMIGVNVVEKGTRNGTVTDLEGHFSLGSVKPGAVISFTYVGYVDRELSVAEADGTVLLSEDAKSLSEVVVVGFGTQKKVNLTGSVGTATAKDLEDRPVSSAVQALQGVIPGLNIANQGHGGELNATKSINIRGNGTVGKAADGSDYASGAPLILIDGMEGNLNDINPQDIDNISVLKDAAASSIYGSRAPFGVILVTTKNGKSGRANINYNNSFRFNTPVRMPEMMNSWEWINYFDQGQFNKNSQHLYIGAAKLPDLADRIYETCFGHPADPNTQVIADTNGKWLYDYPWGNVDWLQEYYKKWSSSQEHNVSISGGTDKLSYYVSGNYLKQGGFMRYGTDSRERYNLTGKIGAQLTKVLKLDYSSRYTRTHYSRAQRMNDDFYNNMLRRTRPNRPIYDPNGFYMSDINYINALENGGRSIDTGESLSQQLKLTVTPLENWDIVAELNVKNDNNWNHTDELRVYAHYANDPEQTYVTTMTGPSQDKVSEYSYKSQYLNPNIYSHYDFSFRQHNFGLTAGMQIEQQKYRDLSANRADMISQTQPVLSLTTSSTVYGMSGVVQEWANVGFFGRLNYDYDGKYLFEANLRYDGSSRFRRDSRWTTSPSFSVGWNIAREAFWKPLEDYVNLLKIRVSYGTLANANIYNWYPTYQVISTGAANGDWYLNGAKPNTASAPALVSSSLTWEKIKNTNIGLDWGALRNRLTGSFDYFVRKTTNMMGPGIELPATLGTGVPPTNNTDMKTFGWELQIGWRDKIRDFSYGVRLSIADSQARILRYANPTKNLGNYIEGELIGNIYGYTTIGIARTDEEMNAHLANVDQSPIGNQWAAGDIMYADLNGDGKINNGSYTLDDMGDLKKIGNTTPRFTTGINVDASWKGIDFSMFWQGVLKRDWWPGDTNMTFWGITDGEWWSCAMKEHLDYFRTADNALGENLNAYYPRPVFNNKNKKTQTGYLQNAAYMRLKNLQIGYTLPKQLVQKIGLQNLRVYVSGENLLTITGLSKTMDPETCGAGYQSTSQANGTVYPLSKTYSFGLSVNF